MNKLLDILGFVFIMFEVFISAVTFYYLKQQYVRVMKEYYKNENESRKKIIVRNEKIIKKDIIQINTTQYIDTAEINKQIGLAQLTFSKKGTWLSNEKMTQNRTRIGRDPRNDIVINDYTVSRKQCLIDKEDDKFILKNYSHKNVTRVNGKPVKKHKEIKEGDVVQIGNVTFVFDNIFKAV